MPPCYAGPMVKFPWERDRERTCTACGEKWQVPYALRQKPPPSRRDARAGVSSRDVNAPGSTTKASAAYAANQADARRAAHDARLEHIDAMAKCPGCAGREFTEVKL